MPLFGQILAALYQADIVEEEDLRAWHSSPSARGVGLTPGVQTDNIRKCWSIGTLLIQQIGQQDSGGEESEEEVDDDEDEESE